MMKNIFKISLYTIAVSAIVVACTKDKLIEVRSEINYANSDVAEIRLIHALSSNSINTVSPVVTATAPPALNFFVNGVRLNAISSAVQSFTTPYGGSFPGTAITNSGSTNTNGNNVFDYAVVPSGPSRVTGAMFRLTGASVADSVVSTSLNFDKWKKYTVIAADTIPNQRFYAFEDVFVTPDTGSYGFRFINLAMNIPTVGAAPTALDVFSRRRQANLVSNIAYRSASAFVQSKIGQTFNGIFATMTDTLEIRAAGTTVPLVQINGFFPINSRVYTFIARGVSTNVAPRNLNVAGFLNR